MLVNRSKQYISTSKLIENLNSWLVAIMISANTIGISINHQFNVENPLVFIIICSFASSMVINRKIPSITTIMFCLHFLLFFSVSYMFADNKYLKDYFISFIFYAIPSFYIIKQPFDTDKMLRNIIIIYTLLFPIYLSINFQLVDPGSRMGYGYSTVPGIMAAIYCMVKMDNRFMKKIYYVFLLLMYLYISSAFSSRGIYLTIMVFIILLFSTRNSSGKNIMYGLIGLILVIFISIEIQSILLKIDSIGRTLKINVINHMIILLERNDFSNGRTLLYHIAKEQIFDRVLIGHGIGMFQSVNGVYVHNFILQILHEGGIIFALPVIVIAIRGVIAIFNRQVDSGSRHLLIFLFSLSIIKLMVSSVFWKEQAFWMYMIISLELIIPLKKRIFFQPYQISFRKN